jgi:hypothetical protein
MGRNIFSWQLAQVAILMAYSLHQQYLDLASGFHVIELRDERGNRHLVQISVGHDSCPACGAVHPKTNLGELDPKAAIAQINEALNTSQNNLMAYAAKHGLKVK